MESIFASPKYKPLFTRYRASIQFRDHIMGGIPLDPKLIEGWIKKNIPDLDDPRELQRVVLRTIEERTGKTIDESLSPADLDAAISDIAAVKETTGFKRDAQYGLYIEDRQVKAAIKEATNILYPWTGGQAKQKEAYGIGKSAKSYLAERVFVSPRTIWLGRAQPDGVEMIVGHVSGPQGQRSTLGYHEYVEQPVLTFDILVTRDAINHEWWPDLFQQMEENGIGALRSQSFGRFVTLSFEQIDPRSNAPEPPHLD
jgi:hypothetical protein